MIDDDLIRQLKAAVPPWRDDEERDLWPRMERRIQEAPRFGWFELALAASILLTLAVRPELIPMLLWNL
jgi:hypothetical protein